ncbi:MAG: hypothetical protein K5873_02620, partial [Treponema sp.]|nr:hypothetical protein [Treponema sp.]
MKKIFKLPACLLLLSTILFSGCQEVTDALGITYSGITPNQSASWAYTSSNNVYIVDENVSSITITGDLGGKELYCSAVNTSDVDIDSAYVKYITTSPSRALEYAQADLEETDFYDSLFEDKINPYWSSEYIAKWKPDELQVNLSARTLDTPVSAVNTAVTQLSISDSSIGSLKKTVHLLADSNNNGILTKKTTLWAYNDCCNVWVADDDQNLTSDALKREYAERFAEKFASFYELERKIFGKESDEIYYPVAKDGKGYWEKQPMNYLSDTGTKVNIVLYDIDYDKEKGGILGFFNPGDYYPDYDDLTTIFEKFNLSTSTGVPDYHSNEGKYFYIDSYFAKSEETKDKILSTLAHEFQHMINFGVKYIEKELELDTNLNEMLSMLCEDMLQDRLGLEDKSSPKIRFPSFLTSYSKAGIRNYSNTDGNTSLYYSTAYAFGSWLCRNYGGAALVKEIMSND